MSECIQSTNLVECTQQSTEKDVAINSTNIGGINSIRDNDELCEALASEDYFHLAETDRPIVVFITHVAGV